MVVGPGFSHRYVGTLRREWCATYPLFRFISAFDEVPVNRRLKLVPSGRPKRLLSSRTELSPRPIRNTRAQVRSHSSHSDLLFPERSSCCCPLARFTPRRCSNPGLRCLSAPCPRLGMYGSAAATTATDRRLTLSGQVADTVALRVPVVATVPGPDHLEGRLRVRLEFYQVSPTVARAVRRPHGPDAHGHGAGSQPTSQRQRFLPSVLSAPRELSSPGVVPNL